MSDDAKKPKDDAFATRPSTPSAKANARRPSTDTAKPSDFDTRPSTPSAKAKVKGQATDRAKPRDFATRPSTPSAKARVKGQATDRAKPRDFATRPSTPSAKARANGPMMDKTKPRDRTQTAAQQVVAPDRNGTVFVTQRGPIKIHTYVSPADGLLVGTQIVEGPTKLVIFDGQLLKPYADEVAVYASRLGKQLDRIIVSNGYPDHWLGLEGLTARFRNVEIYALPGVAEFIRATGGTMLDGLRRNYGDKLAERVTAPTRVLAEGPLTIDGMRFDFRRVLDVAFNIQLLALMPEHAVTIAFDLVFAPHHHVSTVASNFDHWIGILENLKAADGPRAIVIGRGAPTDRSAYDATIAYLRRAKEIYVSASDGKSYAEALKVAFPDRQHPDWADLSGRALYAARK